MRDLPRLSDAELEAALSELGVSTRFPWAPDVSARVMDRLKAGAGRRTRGHTWRWSLAAAALVAIGATLSVAVSPGLRQAVADWLGVPGIRISAEPRELDPAPDLELHLGRRLTLSQARARVDFDIAVPGERGLGPFDSLRLMTPPDGGQVSLLYKPRPGLPAAKSTGIGLLLSQHSGEVRDEFMHKVANTGVRVEAVRVDDEVGYWLEGRPHFVLYVDTSGNVREDTVRFADNVLLWERDGVVFRLESALGKDRALEIARSVG